MLQRVSERFRSVPEVFNDFRGVPVRFSRNPGSFRSVLVGFRAFCRDSRTFQGLLASFRSVPGDSLGCSRGFQYGFRNVAESFRGLQGIAGKSQGFSRDCKSISRSSRGIPVSVRVFYGALRGPRSALGVLIVYHGVSGTCQGLRAGSRRFQKRSNSSSTQVTEETQQRGFLVAQNLPYVILTKCWNYLQMIHV